MKRLLTCLAILYLAVLLGLWGAIRFDVGNWWPVTLFLFSPRWVVALPLLLLVPLSAYCRWRWTAVYLLHATLIAFPILGTQLAWPTPPPATPLAELRLLTCNVGGGELDQAGLIRLIREHQVQALLLQECPRWLAEPIFGELGWGFRQHANLSMGSSLPLGESQILVRQPPGYHNAIAAMSCRVQLGEAAARATSDSRSLIAELVCVHFPTFRPGFEKARRFDAEAGASIDALGEQYRGLAEELQQRLQTLDSDWILAGDFNVPSDSAFYRDYWAAYPNALSEVASGLLYTKYTRLHGVRIDHVIVAPKWHVNAARVGPNLGGDHRPVLVELSLLP